MVINGYDLSKDLVLEVGKFAILWNCFERDLFKNHCNPSKIINSYQNIQIDRDKLQILVDVLNKRRVKFEFDFDEYIEQGLHPNNSTISSSRNIQLMENFLKQNSDDNICGGLLTILRLRNNLMHGLKDISELEEQIELFRAVNAVLQSAKGI